ncbi:MAG: AbrB/MazE/SpoVT family DNA-binding domain-containing protein [Deltaproteobacteria bacterium]|nr:AbrB/MazE/SpoVT family DNA-binding domain-containing protein [Deltaproteobacteria bacterium]
MIKKLTTIGNSLGIIIERPILELLRIDRETLLEVSTDGDALIIRPNRAEHGQNVKASTKRMMDQHDKTMRKLAE